ncbi:MAG: polysaccharide deacetylase family protein [Cellulosilyticaceae bacterium]
MKKKIKGLCMVLIVVMLLVIKASTIEQKVYQYTPITTENVVVGLNYHYVRERSLWAQMIEILTQTPDLKTYSVYADEFEKQMDILIEEGAYFATLEEVLRFKQTGEYPKKCVWISFDDADRSVYEYAYPILKERNIPFTMFVVAGQVGNSDFNNLDVLGWEELAEMKESGLVSFGSHTYDMHYVGDERAIFLEPHMYQAFFEDVHKSIGVLEENLGVPITTLAYPFGETNTTLTQLVKEAGFKAGVILAPYGIDPSSEMGQLPRYLIDRNNFYEVIVPWLQTNQKD